MTHEWWRSEIEATTSGATRVGGTFTLRGRVLRSGQAVGAAQVLIIVRNDANDAQVESLSATTETSGAFAVSWTSLTPRIEEVTISATGTGGFTADAITHHAWSAGSATDTLTIEALADVRVGASLLVRSQLIRGTDPVLNPPIEFLTSDGWRPSNVNDGPDTEARFLSGTLTSPGGTVSYGVRTAEDGLHLSSRARWWQPLITFVAPDSRSTVGQEYPATVVVTDNGVPMPGVELTFSASGSEYDTVITDDEGRASAPYEPEPAAARVESISVAEVLDEDDDPPGGDPVPATAITSHTWAGEPAAFGVDLTLTQPSEDSRVGNGVRLTATVSDDGNLLRDWDVQFRNYDGDDLGLATTGEEGTASVVVTQSTESSVYLVATVQVEGCGSESAAVTHYWWLPELDLTPEEASAPARRNVVFTAELTRPDPSDSPVPVPSQAIRFTQTSQSCDLPVVIVEATTDPDGIVSAPLSRDGPSIDEVRAEEVGVVDPQGDSTTHTWGNPDPPPLSIALGQSTPSSRAGSEITITATVFDADRPNGRAGSGIPVTFLGVSPSRTVDTDNQGEARLTVTGTGTSPTTVTATAPFGCGVVLSPPITHQWFVPSLLLVPDNGVTTVGDTAYVTARLRNGAAPVPGQAIELTIDSSTPSVDTITRTATTAPNGEATFDWTRDEAGVDTLTAAETNPVQPQQDTASHTWESPPPKPDTPSPQPPTTPPPTTPVPDTPTPFEDSESPTSAPPTSVPPTSPPPTSAPPTSPPPTSAPPTSPPPDLPATSKLVDGPEVGRPGGDIEVSGTGCRAGEALAVRLGDTELGTTRAAADGTFYLRAAVPDLPLGRYLINATCGRTIGDPNVDITEPQVNQSPSAIAAIGATTASTFVFFVLIIKGIISFLPRRPF